MPTGLPSYLPTHAPFRLLSQFGTITSLHSSVALLPKPPFLAYPQLLFHKTAGDPN